MTNGLAALTRALQENGSLRTGDAESALAVLLKKHAIVLVGGSARIISWRRRNLFPGDTCSVRIFVLFRMFKHEIGC